MSKHLAKKRFGQNFLTDESVIYHIISCIAPSSSDRLVEIGPGLGAITLPLLPLVKSIDAIELDRDVIPLLEKKSAGLGTLVIHESDALTFKLEQLNGTPEALRVVGNLPYNISTPLLFHLFGQLPLIKDMHFMLQKEVGERLAAKPGSKQYGRLTVMAQYYCQVDLLFHVYPHSFTPAPKVDSVFLRLIPKRKPDYPAKSLKQLELIVRTAFSQRRKTIYNTLKQRVTREQLTEINIDPNLRPEQLTIENFVQISNISILEE